MKNRVTFLCAGLSLGLTGTLQAQIENAHWVFTLGHGYDFRETPPVPLLGIQTPRQRGMATMSDAEGELLFYADDHQVFNRLHQVMPGGEALNGSVGTPFQGAFALIWPGHVDSYYLITKPIMSSPEHDHRAYYHVVDMSAEDGLGAVVLANQVLADSVFAPLTAVPHATDNAWWIILYHGTQHAFHSYRLDSSGMAFNPVVSAVGTPPTMAFSGNGSRGFLRPNVAGDRLVWTKYYGWDGPALRYLELFDFDANTGMVSNYRQLDGPFHFWGAEFSPSGNYLYVTDLTCEEDYTSRLWQYDVSLDQPETILASKTLMHAYPPGQNPCMPRYGGLATAYDGRIYAGCHGGMYMGVITQPDLPYPDCAYIYEGLGNGIHQVNSQPPNQPRAFPKADITSVPERIAMGASLLAWPNPASGQLFVQATGALADRSTLRLFAADGRLVREERPLSWPHAMDIQSLAPGLHLLRWEGPKGAGHARVVIE